MDELTVTWLLPDGQVGGPAGKKSTFKARGAFPGDVIRPTTVEKRGRTQLVEAYDVVSRVPRLPHPCVLLDHCGGCDLGALDPEVRKAQLIRMASHTLNTEIVPDWIGDTSPHRSRIKLSFEDGKVGYHPPRDASILPIEDCPIAHPLIREEIPRLLGSAQIAGKGEVELRTDGQKVAVCFEGRPAHGDLVHEHVAVNGKAVQGDPTLALTVAGMTLRASPRSFFQVNATGNERLTEWVVDRVLEVDPERVLDLYAGIGNLTLPIARARVPTTAIELEGQATRDLKHNMTFHRLTVDVHTSAVERFDLTRVPFDVVVLDPPRAGAGRVMQGILQQRPRRVVYVACHLPSAARDLKPLTDAGYRLRHVALVDLFPGTHHIETLLTLDRP